MPGRDTEGLREEVKKWASGASVDGEQWFFLRVEVEAPQLDENRLLNSLGPRLGLRKLDSRRYAVEGHAEFLDIPGLLDGAASALSDVVESDSVDSIIVESHDYELIDAPVLYLEGR